MLQFYSVIQLGNSAVIVLQEKEEYCFCYGKKCGKRHNVNSISTEGKMLTNYKSLSKIEEELRALM